MKLYYSPLACSLAPHFVANEAGVALELVKVDLRTKKTAAGRNYAEINPLGYVPLLELDDGVLLTEAQVICQYLADLKPASGLMPPAGQIARYRTQAWLAFVSTEVHKPMGSMFHKLPQETLDSTRSKLAQRLAYVDEHLAGKTYLMGDAFTAPDAYLWTVLNWAGMVKFDLSPYSNIAAFQAKVAARPALQQALKEEGVA
jgi:glutathione S-transferase